MTPPVSLSKFSLASPVYPSCNARIIFIKTSFFKKPLIISALIKDYDTCPT
jgi:hypothetical protein